MKKKWKNEDFSIFMLKILSGTYRKYRAVLDFENRTVQGDLTKHIEDKIRRFEG